MFAIPARGGVPDSILPDFADLAVTWGADTNLLCAGVRCLERGSGTHHSQSFRVVVLTSKTNALPKFVAPPARKLRSLELRGPDGNAIPLRKSVTSEMPQKISVKDLARTPETPRSAGILERVYLKPRIPEAIAPDFRLQDVFYLKEDGDYILTVGVTLYELALDAQSVSRVDLPKVTVKLHLTKSRDD
jgi:hypothetical protein